MAYVRTISSSKSKVVGPPIDIGSTELRMLVLSIMSIFRYIEETWFLDRNREKILRYHLDNLLSLHGCPSLDQLIPYYPKVCVFSTDQDPRNINPKNIHSDLANHYATNDCMFDMRVLTVKNEAVIDAFLFPWEILEGESSGWGRNINFDDYRVPIPNDIKPEHHRVHG